MLAGLASASATHALGAAPAFGWTATREGSTIVVAAPGPEANELTVAVQPDGALRIQDVVPLTSAPPAGCQADEPDAPTGFSCAAGSVGGLRADLGPLDDRAAVEAAITTALTGAEGADELSATSAPASLVGGPGADELLAGSGADVLDGGDGDDALEAGDGDDLLAGGAGQDGLDGGTGRDELRGDAGDDALVGGGGDDGLGGGEGVDALTGGEGADLLRGEAGDDSLDGEGGDDTLEGGEGDDGLFAGAGADRVAGAAGADLLDGGAGRDAIDAGDGDDSVEGGPDGDVADGGPGRDTLVDLAGADQLSGGPDADSISVGATGSADGQDGPDTITVEGGGSAFGGTGADVLDATGALGPVTLAGGDGDDAVTGGTAADRLAGDGGQDRLDGGEGDDRQDGGDGDDTLAWSAGSDLLLGSDGVDRATYADSPAPVEVAIDGTPTDGGPGEGDLVDPTVEGLEGSPQADVLSLGTSGGTVDGGDGADRITGGPGLDLLLGAGDDDLLDGGAGGDVLLGGDGTDGVTYANRRASVRVTLDAAAGDGQAGEGDRVDPSVENVTGGAGADVLVGSPLASNALAGGAGNDLIAIRDSGGLADAALCGSGRDRVSADVLDRVARDCETARIDGVLVPLAERTGRLPRIFLLTSRARVDAAGRVRLKLRCPAASRTVCRGVVRLERRGRVLARSRLKIRTGSTRTVRLRLSRRTIRRLRALRAVSPTVTQVVRLTGASSASTKTLRLSFKRKGRRG